MADYTSFPGVGVQRRRNDGDCHIIVCGNEKGGSGKSTTAIHLAIAVATSGFRVDTVDLDARQQTLTRHLQYRRELNAELQVPFISPRHHAFTGSDSGTGAEIEKQNTIVQFSHLMDRLKAECDFVIIDTPGSYTALSVAAHKIADTLVTPINDSFIDFDVLARVDANLGEIGELSQYALAVREARRHRQISGSGILDWVIVRNRLSPISSRNERRVAQCLQDLSKRLGFRISHGIGERVIFREYFQEGLTALDTVVDDVNGKRQSVSRLTARAEVRRLVAALQLPINEHGRRKAQLRRQWLQNRVQPGKLPSVFA